MTTETKHVQVKQGQLSTTTDLRRDRQWGTYLIGFNRGWLGGCRVGEVVEVDGSRMEIVRVGTPRRECRDRETAIYVRHVGPSVLAVKPGEAPPAGYHRVALFDAAGWGLGRASNVCVKVDCPADCSASVMSEAYNAAIEVDGYDVVKIQASGVFVEERWGTLRDEMWTADYDSKSRSVEISWS